nr:histidine kinase [Propionicimonas sp.]
MATLAFTVAGLFAVSILAFGDWSRPGELAVEVALCLAAGSSGRWLVPGGITTGVLLSALALLSLEAPRFSTLTVQLVFLVAGSRGRWLVIALFAVWYLPVLAMLEAGGFSQPDRYLAALGVGVFGLGLAVTIGWFIHRQVRARERLTLDHSRALTAQRQAIARDLHDTVAQATTAIVLRAESAKLRPEADPELLVDLDYIATVGRNSLRDLRGMLRAMRSAGNDAVPDLALRTTSFRELLDAQVAVLTEAGFDVRVLVQVRPEQLPTSIGYTLNCVLSEATTNILRHARPGARCAIMVSASASELEILVSNEVGGRTPVPSNRFGLIGLTERVSALGGTVDVLSRERNWVLQVRLPLIPDAAMTSVEE